MLTTGVDTIVGTDKNDIVNGVVSSLSSENTLGSSDTIDGGAGQDKLVLDMKGNFTGLGSAGSIKNVETIKATNTTTLDRSFNAKNITDVAKYDLDSAKAISLSNLKAAGIEVAAKGFQSNFSVAFDTALDLTGTSDAMTFTFDGLGKAAVKNALDVVTTAQVDPDITMTGIEEITMKTTGGASFVDLSKMDATSYTISGASDLTIAAVKNGLKTVDASALSGKLDINTAGVTTAASITSIQAGSGDDVISAEAQDLVANATIAGGAGADKLILSGTASTTQYTMSGVETVAFSNTGAITFSGTNVDGLSNIELLEAGNAAVTAVNLGAKDMVLTTKGDIAITQAISLDNSGKATVNLEVKDKKSADDHKKATGAALAANDEAQGDITLTNASNVEINVGAYTEYKTGTIEATKATDVTLNVASSKNSATPKGLEQTAFNGILDAKAATTLTINAQGSVTTVVGTDISKVQNLTISADQAVDLSAGTQDLAAASNVVLSGAKTASAITLDNVGVGAGDAVDYALSLQATGLKAGLTTADVKSQQGLTIDVSGVTGAATFAALEGSNVTLTANTIGGALLTTTVEAKTANQGTAEINAKNAASNVTIGTIGAIKAFKTVNVDASGTLGNIVLGDITASDTVTVNLANVLGTASITNITAKSAVTFTTGLKAVTDAATTGTPAITFNGDATASTATLTGATGNDVFTVTGGAKQESITVKGDLASGTNVINVVLVDSTATAQTVDFSSFTNASSYTSTLTTIAAELDSNVTVKGSAGTSDAVALGTSTAHTGTITLTDVEQIQFATTASINASAVSAQKIDIKGSTGALTLKGSTSADTIDLSKLTTADASTIVVEAGKGDDTITLGALTETVKFEATAVDNGHDTIKEIAVAADKVDFTAFLGGAHSVNTTSIDGAAADLNMTTGTNNVGVLFNKATLTAADIATATGSNKVVMSDDGKAVIFVSADADGTTDTTVNDWSVYYVEDTDTGATQTWAVTLVGTIDNATELSAADIQTLLA